MACNKGFDEKKYEIKDVINICERVKCSKS